MKFTISDPYTENRMEEYYQLRWKVLRAPWNQPRGTERDEMEDASLHRVVLNEQQRILACGRLQLNTSAEAQVRYMAVDPDFRGKGLGRLVLQELECLASDAGALKVILQARENALPFYTACGYEVVIPTFLLYDTIQHYLMQKVI
jgi:predicted GNAT family N-acyltransferase